MLLATLGLVLMFDGIPPAQMANIVADRLDRLDRLVIDLDVQVFLAPLTAAFDDPSTWDGPYPPGSGARRRVTIVRPQSLEAAWRAGEEAEGSASAFAPGRTVQRLRSSLTPITVYNVNEDLIDSSTYTTVPTLTMFDVQVHESFVPGLNSLRLLRDYPTELLRVEGDVNTYRTQLQVNCFGETWTETHEFDLNSCGTLLRHRFRREDRDFWFEREFHVLSTQEVNGAELPSVFVSMTRNSVTPNFGVHRFTVTAASRDAALVLRDVQIEPDRRNSSIHTTHADLSRLSQRYDENGVLVASSEWGSAREICRRSILPLSASTALLGVCGVALVRRGRIRRRPQPRESVLRP